MCRYGVRGIVSLGVVLLLAACGGERGGGQDTTMSPTDTSAHDAQLDSTASNGDTTPEVVVDVVIAPDAADVMGDQGHDARDAVLADTVSGDIHAPDMSDSDRGDLVDDGLSGQALREALQAETMAGHTPLGYDGARDAMYALGGAEDANGRIICIYTGRSVDTNGSRTPSNNCTLVDGTPTTCNFNTEHTWARYHLRAALTDGSAEYLAAEGDMHHIFPSDDAVNNARWHFPFGETDCRSAGSCAVDEESALGLASGGAGDPACPVGNLAKDKDCNMLVRPARRGDLARSQLYMAVRYGMHIDAPTESALRAWHVADPVDAWEQRRNGLIEAAQGNRNPFVDRPELVARITDF